jgi:hypothetical protein
MMTVNSNALSTGDSGTTHELTGSGSAGSEGEITLSADGRYLLAPGYHQPVGTDSVADTDAAALYSWDGVAADAPVKGAVTVPTPAPTAAWEGIGAVPDPLTAGSSLYLIQDDGDVVWYNDGDDSKDGLTSQYMKFLGDSVTWK